MCQAIATAIHISMIPSPIYQVELTAFQSIRAPFLFPNLPNSTSSAFLPPTLPPSFANLGGIIPAIDRPLPREIDRAPGPL